MFYCDKCGLCCRKVYKSEMYQHLDRGDGICYYLDEKNNLCTIYDDRPWICNVDIMYEKMFFDSGSKEEYYLQNYYACNCLKMEERKMSDIRSALVEKFKDIFGYDCGDDYAPRVSNARSIICQGKYKKEEMIEIFDTSIGSNGKSGLVLTVDSVCVKDAGNFTSKFIAKYSDIDYTYMDEDRFLGMDMTALVLVMKYGSNYKISIDKFDKDDMMSFIDYAISLYAEEDKLEW